ncbi:MAG: HAD hydrolase-like protein [Syntrophomonadaceae bacterium]|nr:HAD hydrolase-like protein [Syntrophomonadaceae bacterium]MDD3889795.1 HAD hydrolase-like protein [Syntrophomonadaceae bacterium]MDD4549352.1 HAD hydrolase-like protein [Syntrophomonadaceae bacterium]
MLNTVLFDLDGTLLNIDMECFLKKYFASMMVMANEYGYQSADKLAAQVYKSTDVMIADLDHESTNEEVFMRDFYANWAYPPEEFQSFFEKFYEERFPLLHKYCRPFPGVKAMMEKLFARGLKVVVATNAVFPLSALQNRLDWAQVGHFDYELITSYEVMHFCKPHVQYYEEICDKIGVLPHECLMVGNDVGEDLIAGKAGMKTFLVEDMLIDRGENLQPDYRGRLTDLFKFMEGL